MAYALVEEQPLEEDRQDPFYVRIEEQVCYIIVVFKHDMCASRMTSCCLSFGCNFRKY